LRLAHLVLAGICLAQLSLGDDEAAVMDTSLVEQLQSAEESEPVNQVKYTKIPGMALREDSVRLKNIGIEWLPGGLYSRADMPLH